MNLPTDPNQYPPGWNRERVQGVIDYYENQSADDELAEIEEAEAGCSWRLVPNEILPAVEALIDAHESRKDS